VTAITDDHDERALIEAAQADPARFVDLYERHFHRVYAYVIRRTGNRAEAEDITSEVFERALVNLPRFEWRGVPLVAWLFRIAANAMADRRQQIERDSANLPQDIPDEAVLRVSPVAAWRHQGPRLPFRRRIPA